jgi:peptide/nickel transport system substrate-binding protein
VKFSELETSLNRRAFLGYSALATAGLLVVACGGDDDDDDDTTDGGGGDDEPTATEASGAEATSAEEEPTEGEDPTSEPEEPSAGGSLTYAEAGDFNDFNPWTVSAVNMSVYNQVFSRLLWKDSTGAELPDLAESWEMSEDGLTFTVTLREGVSWHDGTPFIADDYVTMFGYTQDEALLENPTIQKHAGLIARIADVVATDDVTLEFQFDEPVPYITDILDYWFAIRIDDPADVGFLESLPVGTGAFEMTGWTPGQRAELVKFEDYYDENLPHLDELTITRLEAAETLIPNLESGAAQVIQITSPADVEPLEESGNYSIIVNESSGSYFNILVNLMKPPFDQREVRQALSYSLNRASMVDAAFFGVSRPITSPFYLDSSIAYRDDLVTAHAFDLEQAAALLEEAGVSGLEMETNVTPRWPQMKLFMLIWQQDLEQLGITLTVNEVETAQFYEVGGAGDLLGFDIHPWLNARVGRDPAIFWSTQTNYRGDPEVNKFGFVNEELEDLVAEGAVEVDQARRAEIYQRLNEIVVEEQHVIQVATDPRIWAFAQDISGVAFDLNGYVRFGETAVG